MAFFRKSNKQNFDVLSGYSWYVPGMKGMFALLAALLFGALLGNVAVLCMLPLGKEAAETYGTLISYPVMFIPAMIYAKTKSYRSMTFETGYRIDSSHFTEGGAAVTMLICMIATMAMAFALDAVNALMPPMPEALEKLLDSMTQGNFLLNFISVSIFAPFFEEWLCRGMILRGLLNHKRADGSCMKPLWAIIISALFFAVIHMNPWQAIPAFAIGCLMGYVYYRTGSLKLTMLMHFTNNTLALAVGQIDSLKDCDSWMEAMPSKMYWLLFAASLLLIILSVRALRRIPLEKPSGNSDELNGEINL